MSVIVVRFSRVKARAALGFILYFFCIPFALGDSSIDAKCLASPQYLSELKNQLIDPEQDFSCLTDIPSLGQKITTYQLVDIRSGKDLPPISDAWSITVGDLKNKSFLMKRPLLLIGDGFSRVAAAHNCAVLKKSGFSSLKIIVGGADTWFASRAQSSASPKSVNARQFLYEYFNGSLVVIAATVKVAAELSALGLTKFYSLPNASDQQIADIALTKSNSGYDPVAVITDEGQKFALTSLSKLPNVYLMPSGISALKQEIKQNLWSKFNRENIDAGSFCAAK